MYAWWRTKGRRCGGGLASAHGLAKSAVPGVMADRAKKPIGLPEFRHYFRRTTLDKEEALGVVERLFHSYGGARQGATNRRRVPFSSVVAGAGQSSLANARVTRDFETLNRSTRACPEVPCVGKLRRTRLPARCDEHLPRPLPAPRWRHAPTRGVVRRCRPLPAAGATFRRLPEATAAKAVCRGSRAHRRLTCRRCLLRVPPRSVRARRSVRRTVRHRRSQCPRSSRTAGAAS